MTLTYGQRKKLKALAHNMHPMIQVGKKGLTDELASATDKSLVDHELIKIKFVGFKEEKREIIDELAERTKSLVVAEIGHTAIFYRQNPDADKRKIHL